ncbi:hypothetical protein [Burkholderia sp. F1]|uniref:hypothetical protein n=1 Tax=Burkholderia sp. F1 TaxID=3366817 RepID=UPI003D71FD23
MRGWSVVDKIRRAKHDGTFAGVIARWRVLPLELPRMWRSGPMWRVTGENEAAKVCSLGRLRETAHLS